MYERFAMNFLWASIKTTAEMAGNAALAAGQMTKLRGELLLVDRDIKARKEAFGVELYDFVAPLSARPDFFAANDRMTNTVRGPFLAAQREIAAYLIKRAKLKEQLAQAEVQRKAAFPNPATDFGGKVVNAGKAAGFAGNEAKIKTEISMVDTNIRGYKQEFGVAMFDILVELEDKEQWLPTVREIRSMYDRSRQDIDALKKKAVAKENELKTLGGGEAEADGGVWGTQTSAPAPSATGGGLYGSQAPAPVCAPASKAPPVVGAGLYGSQSVSSTTYGSSNPNPPTAPALSLASETAPAVSVLASANPLFGAPVRATDPFASFGSASAAQSHYSAPSSGYSAPQVAPAPRTSYGAPQTFGAPAPAAYDPFSLNTNATPATYDPFANAPPPQVAVDPFMSTAPAPAGQGNYDPFAHLSTSTTQNGFSQGNNDFLL